MRGFAQIAAVMLAVATLGGCYETSTPKQYEPGVYKGAEDPLLEKLESGDLRAELDERFKRAARDR